MYKPPFTSFKRPNADPSLPTARVGTPAARPGSKVYDCPVISKGGAGPVEQKPKVQLVDHRKVRQQERNVDRHKDIVTTPMATMSTASDESNKEFTDALEDAKMAEFWVFPEECTSVYMNKVSGLAYANVCLIGINGKQWPLFPGNNRAPGFVYEALEDNRELKKRFQSKLAPPKSSGRSVILSDPRSAIGGRGRMMTNQELFNDSMLGRPNYYDSSQDTRAANLIRQHREAALKQK
jgi:hypothetical protein